MNLNNKIYSETEIQCSEIIDNTVQEYNELMQALQKEKNPTICRAIQNEIDELRSALDTIRISNTLN